MEKELIIRINHAQVNFTNVEQIIAKHFLDGKELLSIHELADLLSVSSASITRFCKKIGLNNYKELSYLYAKHLEELKLNSTNNIELTFKSAYYDIIDQIDACFDKKKLESFAEAIYKNRVIHIFALGLSATSAQDFKFRFSRYGKFIEVIYDKDAILMSSKVLQEGDLAMFISLRGNELLAKVAEDLRKRKVKVLSICANKYSKLVKNSDLAILTANLKGEESTGLISGQLPLIIQIDFIHYIYIKKYTDEISKWQETEEAFKERK